MRVFLLASIIYRLGRKDPVGFLAKTSERLRQNGLCTPVFADKKRNPSTAQKLADRGELSCAIDVADSTLVDRVLRTRLAHQLEELHAAPPVKKTLKKDFDELKVLYFATNSLPYTASGYTQRTHSILRSLREHGVHIEAMTRLAYPLVVGKWPRSKTQFIDGVPYHRLLPKMYPATLFQRHIQSIRMLTQWVRDQHISVLHTTTNFPNGIVISRVAQECGLPWIYEVRGELERTWLTRLPQELQDQASSSEFYQLARAQETAYASAADAVVVLSEISRQQMIERGVDAKKIHVVPNSMDDAIFGMDFDKQELKKELNLPVNKVLVGSITSVVDYEGLDVLIEAVKYLPDNYVALIVGEGTAKPGLEKLAKSLGISERVIFAGRQLSAEIYKWYAVLDVFALPRHDTLVCRTVTPVKALSAQALGIPVIASDLPALREVTGEVETYVPAGQSVELADAILNVEEHPAGKKWAASRTWNMAAQKYQQLYQSLLRGSTK